MSGSSGQSWMAGDRMKRVIDGDHTVTAASPILTKDVGLALDTGQDLKFPLPLGSLALQDLSEMSLKKAEKIVRKTLGASGKGGNAAAAAVIGKRIAEKAKAAGVEKVAFDRAGFAYHGRVKALAEAAREAGLQF